MLICCNKLRHMNSERKKNRGRYNVVSVLEEDKCVTGSGIRARVLQFVAFGLGCYKNLED